MEKQAFVKVLFFPKEHDEEHVKGENNSVLNWMDVLYSMLVSQHNFRDTDKRFY